MNAPLTPEQDAELTERLRAMLAERVTERTVVTPLDEDVKVREAIAAYLAEHMPDALAYFQDMPTEPMRCHHPNATRTDRNGVYELACPDCPTHGWSIYRYATLAPWTLGIRANDSAVD